MAYLSKEAYQGKTEWADNRQINESQSAFLRAVKSLPQEQYEAMEDAIDAIEFANLAISDIDISDINAEHIPLIEKGIEAYNAVYGMYDIMSDRHRIHTNSKSLTIQGSGQFNELWEIVEKIAEKTGIYMESLIDDDYEDEEVCEYLSIEYVENDYENESATKAHENDIYWHNDERVERWNDAVKTFIHNELAKY